RPGAGADQLQAALADGKAIEVAVYDGTPELARGLRSLKLADLLPPAPVTWLEVVSQHATDMSPAARRVAGAWQERGVALSTGCVVGPPFWNTLEMTEARELIAPTLAAMLDS